MPIKVNSNFCSLLLPVYSTYAIHDVLENIKILLYIKYGLSPDSKVPTMETFPSMKFDLHSL